MSRMPTERFNPTIYRSTHWDSTHRLPTKPSQRLNTGIEDYTQNSFEEIVQNYSAMSEAAKRTQQQKLMFLKKETNVKKLHLFLPFPQDENGYLVMLLPSDLGMTGSR